MKPLLLAARAFHLALVVVAPALSAAASGRSYADSCGTAQFVLMGLATVALAFGPRPGQAMSRQLMLPTLLALATLGLALRAPPATALDISSFGALCLAATLGALGSQEQLGEAAPFRFTGRVVAVTALGALGLVALLPLGLGRDPGTKFGGAIAAACVGSLILAAARFEGVLATRRFPEVRARTTGLLLGSWLGLTALAAACLGVALLSLRASANAQAQALQWFSARDSARVVWACALPISGALLVLFAGRAGATGLRVQSARELGFAPVALILPALLGASLLYRFPDLAAAAAAPPALVRAEAPSSVHAALSPRQSAEPRPSEPAEPVEPAEPAAEPAAQPSTPSPAEKDSEVGVEVSVAEGIYEEDARRSILRRVERAHECVRRNPTAHGILSVRVVIDAGGSVTNVVPLSGDLLGSDFAKCAMLWMYRVGFAPPRSRETAKFEVTLHFPGGGP